MSFMEIFQPGLKHLREERERRRVDVAYPTNGADPLMDIDLDAGTAMIVIPRRPAPPDPGAQTDAPVEDREQVGEPAEHPPTD